MLSKIFSQQKLRSHEPLSFASEGGRPIQCNGTSCTQVESSPQSQKTRTKRLAFKT
ncbi:hypothetical protein RBSH_03868 [Rhodopirellula baltica SH28]|uniref:Uncharacterized protein n=1 Tax=Rhodopirellula baltica SH28 TaxID=993517 RepID=K5D2P5_RHOBT|nr:hypothetical protein RBSH_03868 [Rhodopirellula baltica SH28]